MVEEFKGWSVKAVKHVLSAFYPPGQHGLEFKWDYEPLTV